jgi:hypothetical protein
MWSNFGWLWFCVFSFKYACGKFFLTDHAHFSGLSQFRDIREISGFPHFLFKIQTMDEQG